jgi:hypothetical protein
MQRFEDAMQAGDGAACSQGSLYATGRTAPVNVTARTGENLVTWRHRKKRVGVRRMPAESKSSCSSGTAEGLWAKRSVAVSHSSLSEEKRRSDIVQPAVAEWLIVRCLRVDGEAGIRTP